MPVAQTLSFFPPLSQSLWSASPASMTQLSSGEELGESRRKSKIVGRAALGEESGDRKSTRLNSSHLVISYAVFCLKKKKKRRHHAALNPCQTATPLAKAPPAPPARPRPSCAARCTPTPPLGASTVPRATLTRFTAR